MPHTEAQQQVELRNAVRYRLAASVVFSWWGQGSNRLQGEGVTRDVSTAGVFIVTPTCPPPGATVKMEIFLSAFRIADQQLKLVAEGRVVRVEHPDLQQPENGFAVSSEGFDIPTALRSR